jgi:hypothetical protein
MGLDQGVPVAAMVEVDRVNCLDAQMAESAGAGSLALLGTEAITEDGKTTQA